MDVAHSLGRGNRKWSSESSGAIIVSVESCGGCGQDDGSKLREAVSQSYTLWVWETHMNQSPNKECTLLSPMPCCLQLAYEVQLP